MRIEDPYTQEVLHTPCGDESPSRFDHGLRDRGSEQPSSDGRRVDLLFALKFDEDYGEHVNHGTFWEPSYPAHGTFFWEAWVSPSEGTE